MNELARDLIRDLRSGKLDSEFNMSGWVNSCGTVGCIAGHALMRTYDRFFRDPNEYEFTAISLDGSVRHFGGMSIVAEASEKLGITNFCAADHLFRPDYWLFSLEHRRFKFDYSRVWTDNYRCDLDTIEKMRTWAAGRSAPSMYKLIGPREAANALEWVANGEPYTDWMTAIEKENV